MKKTNIIIWIMLVIAIIGFIDATYLTVNHYNGTDLVCGTSGGCTVVTTSTYSQIFGIPVALFGSLYYFFVASLSLAYLQQKNSLILKMLTYIPIIGFLMSGWFVYLQLYVINAICFYCMGSAITSTLLFTSSIKLFFTQK